VVDVVLLASPGASTNILFHRLARRFSVEVLLEERVSRWQLVRGRYRKLGLWETAGQLAFIALVQPVLGRAARARVREILREHALDDAPIPDARVHRVATVNGDEARARLRELSPRAVVVSGTRIIGKATLSSVSAPFINLHAGITPRYRGVHGGWWALAERRAELCGSTVHVVDAGIDTGDVVEQVTFAVGRDDTFATYPYLHLAAGVPALERAVEAALAGALASRRPLTTESRLRYHPTVWRYLAARLRGVR